MKNLFLITLTILLFSSQIYADVLTVGTTGDYQSISSAVNAASDNDTIYLQNGIYHETIATSKILNFKGESKNSVIWSAFIEPSGSPEWSKTSGYDNVYEANVSEIVSSGTVCAIIDENGRGIYNAVDSISEVDELPGQHYTTGNKIYVRCPDDASPSTHTLWFSTTTYQNILTLKTGGSISITDITFLGATQSALYISDTATDLGTINIDNCNIFSCASGLIIKTSDGNVGGDLNITRCRVMYSIYPVYDIDYSVHTTEDGDSHFYKGTSLSLTNLENIVITASEIQYSRSGIMAYNVHNFTISSCTLANFTVHPIEFGEPAGANAVYTIENSIFAGHGSTIYTPGIYITDESNDGFRYNFYNNIFYPGEASKQIFDPTESPSDTANISDVQIYWYNNISFSDWITVNFNGSLNSNNIHMDENYYSVGNSSDILRLNNVSYTLSEWQNYTDSNGWSQDSNSSYFATPEELQDYLYTNNGRNISSSFDESVISFQDVINIPMAPKNFRAITP